MQHHYADETGIKSLKIRHNNVLGYFIEVTANRVATLTGSDEARARFIRRQTTASLMRFTTTELAGLESRIANAADQALTIELGIFDTLAQTVTEESERLSPGRQLIDDLLLFAAEVEHKSGFRTAFLGSFVDRPPSTTARFRTKPADFLRAWNSCLNRYANGLLIIVRVATWYVCCAQQFRLIPESAVFG